MKSLNPITKLILKNPLVKRYRYSLLRPSQLWIYLTIYVAVVLLLLFVNYNIHQIKNTTIIYEKFCSDVYYQFAALQFLILCLWAMFNSRSALKQEIFDKTYDFFRLLPLSALQKTVGILVGRNIHALLFAGVTFVIIVALGLLGKVSAFLQFQIILLLLTGAVFTNSAALLSFNTTTGKRKKTSIAVWILLFIFFGPFLLHFLFLPFYAMSQIPKAEYFKVEFYNVEFYILILISLNLLYFSIWNILGITRKFTYENEPLFNRKGAIIFLIGYELIALGFFLPHLLKYQTAVYIFWAATLTPVLLVPIGSIKSFDDYLESCGIVLSRRESAKSITSTLFTHSNITLGFTLFAVWLTFSVFAGLMCDLSTWQFIFNIAVLFSFCLLLLLLLELYVVYSPVFSKIGLLLGFLAILYLFLPIILSFTLQTPTLRFHSLFGFIAHLINPLVITEAPHRTSICIVNALLCTIPVLLTSKRYFHILTLRKEM